MSVRDFFHPVELAHPQQGGGLLLPEEILLIRQKSYQNSVSSVCISWCFLGGSVVDMAAMW